MNDISSKTTMYLSHNNDKRTFVTIIWSNIIIRQKYINAIIRYN